MTHNATKSLGKLDKDLDYIFNFNIILFCFVYWSRGQGWACWGKHCPNICFWPIMRHGAHNLAHARLHLHLARPHASFTAWSFCLHLRENSSSLGTNVAILSQNHNIQVDIGFIISKLIDGVPSHSREA